LSSEPPGAPSTFFEEEAERVRRAVRAGPALDLACGSGRHALATAALGGRVLAMDRDPGALALLAAAARARALPVQPLRTDLETPHGIPARTGAFALILVFRFLFSPLAPAIAAALRPGGILLYETFLEDPRPAAPGPRTAAFRLAPGELPALFPELELLHHAEGVFGPAQSPALARLVARRRG
jgi:SAM-dependent methyltransferase